MAKAVTIQTSIGDVTLELYWNHAPKACHNFYELAKRGYYDNTIFHRIIKVRHTPNRVAHQLPETYPPLY